MVNFTLENRHLAPFVNKSRERQVGLAIDMQQKELHQAIPGVIVPEDKYAPYDLQVDDFFIDFKSFSQNTITISPLELEFALSHQVVYMIFRQLGGLKYEALGSVEFSKIQKFVRRSKYPMNVHRNGEWREELGWYVFVNQINTLIK